MKANELRIGDWLYSNLNEFNFQVEAEDIANISKTPESVSPIPLTEEWLLKFEFRKAWGLDDAWTDKNNFLEVYNYEGVQEYDSGEKRVKDMKEDEYAICKEDGYVEVSRPFKYVHQLQNIYFALTGEEL